MKKNTAFITILLIAVVVAAVLSIRLFVGRDAPAPSPTPGQINPPVVETTVPPEPTEQPTAAPTATPEPTETPVFETRPPAETAEPTPTPDPVSASGSFRSDTGTYLNLVAEWSAWTDAGGQIKLKVDVSSESYSFFTSALASALELTVNGETYSASSAAVSYDGKDKITSPLASFTVDVPGGNTSVSVVWHYRGSYSGVQLDDIAAADILYIG